MIVDIQCPHCRTTTIVDTHWFVTPNDKIACGTCKNTYRAHMWEVVGKVDDRVKVIFT